MAMMIQRVTNQIINFFGSTQVDNSNNNEHNYDCHILVELLSKLPEDILIEILVRLPADVLVLPASPIWGNLISSPLFVDLHLSRADSVHVVQCVYDCGNTQLGILDCTRERKCMDLVYDRNTIYRYPTLWGSCGGLLSFWYPYKTGGSISIVNPITGENRDISTPTSLNINRYLCGFFFDRFRGQYKLLYVDGGKSHVNAVYYTFDLSESVWTKLDLIQSPSDSRPSSLYPGVLVGDALHWIGDPNYTIDCSKIVVVFKIETQELYSLPHPPVTRGGNNNGGYLISASTRCDFDTHARYMKLIAKDGQLCFCHTIVEEKAIDLWILEDYDNWGSWVKKFKVNLVSIHKIFQSMRSYRVDIFLTGLTIESPQNGSKEILFTCKYWPCKGLYGYHLETNHIRKLETIVPKENIYDYVVLPFTKTILSPMF